MGHVTVGSTKGYHLIGSKNRDFFKYKKFPLCGIFLSEWLVEDEGMTIFHSLELMINL